MLYALRMKSPGVGETVSSVNGPTLRQRKERYGNIVLISNSCTSSGLVLVHLQKEQGIEDVESATAKAFSK